MNPTIDVRQADRQRQWRVPVGTHLLDVSAVTPDTQLSVATTADGMHLTLTAAGAFGTDVTLRATAPIPVAAAALWPTYQGLFERRTPDPAATFECRGPGWQGPDTD